MAARNWMLRTLMAVAVALGWNAVAVSNASAARVETRFESAQYQDDDYYDDSYADDSYDGGYADYDALAPYGTWVSTSYGYGWCPMDVSVGWRPYTVGRWLYSNAGWMWISDDPWGSVPYHYGRWYYDDDYGWVWIPGDVWAPAWVSWRFGGDYVGWAPLPPDVGWTVGIGFRYSTASIDRRLDSHEWCFVPARNFAGVRVDRYVYPQSRNVTLIRSTRNVTRYVATGTMPAERGLRPEWISRAAGRRVTTYRLNEVASRTYGTRPAVRGNEITVFRPKLRAATRGRDDRVRLTPPAQFRGRPNQRLLERQRTDRQQMSQRMTEERRQLNQIHQEETRRPPSGVSRDQLRQRQQAEVREQQNREARMRRSYDQRRQRFEARNDQPSEDQQVAPQPQRQERQQPPQRQRDERPQRGRGRGNNDNNNDTNGRGQGRGRG